MNSYRLRHIQRSQFKNQRLNPNLQVLIFSLTSLKNSFSTPCVQQRINRRITCSNSWETSDWLPLCSIEELYTGGCSKISTINVTTRGPLFLYSRLKTATALEGSPRLSGLPLLLALASFYTTMRQCCSIFLVSVTSQAKKQVKIYIAVVIGDLAFEEATTVI